MESSFVILDQIMHRLENASAHIAMNADGLVECWNPDAVALFGWTAKEAVGRPLADLIIPPSMQPAHKDGLKRWREKQVALVVCRELFTTGHHKDGTMFPVKVSVQAVQSDAGVRFLGWVHRRDAH